MTQPQTAPEAAPRADAWLAVISIALGVASLIIAEFLPAGMLTPMASDLKITEGMAGQAVTATSLFAVITSLTVAYLTRTVNRRHVLLGLTLALLGSNVMVAVAPSFTVLLAGRVFLGVALGGFWSMASATATRLVSKESLPRALGIIYGSSSFAMVLATPLSSFLSHIIGWRNVFVVAAAMSAIALVVQYVSMPSLLPKGNVRLRTVLDVLQKPRFAAAMLAITGVYGGFFAGITYIRPFLESTTAVGPNLMTTLLLAFGVGDFIGTTRGSLIVRKAHRTGLWVLPLLLGVIALGLAVFGESLAATAVLLFIWGATFGPMSVVWSAWVQGCVPEHAESAGGIFVASVHISAATAALVGGVVFDRYGSAGVFSLSAAASLASALIVIGKVNRRLRPRHETFEGSRHNVPV